MRFRGLDLNLLSAFSVLMQERSVSGAARRLNLSQPAVSAALARLRAHFRDDLLVLRGKRMFPTALAESLGPRVDEALQSIAGIVESSGRFDPETSTRSFRIVASDYIVMVLIQPLLQALGETAPHVRIVVELPGERASERLDEGKVDLLITPEEFASPRHPIEPAFEERHVLVGCAANPAFARDLTEADFLTMDHVGVLLGVDTPAAFADRQLEQIGRSRRIAVTVPSFSAVPWMVIGTNRIGLMHERLARLMARTLPIAIRPLPFAFAPMREVVQHHHARGADPGLAWLRERLVRTAQASAPR